MKIRVLWSSVTLALGAVALFLALSSGSVFSQATPTKTTQAFQELFDYSQKEKKGLTFYVQGQTIPGVVTKMIGDDAVEVRNQTSTRIIIRLDRIDAVAAN